MADQVFAAGPFGETVENRRAQVAELLAEVFRRHGPTAEQTGEFPRAVVADLAAAGLIRERWTPGPLGDPGLGVLIAEESGRLGRAGLAVGLSLHCETVASILNRFADNDLLADYLEGVLDGRLLGCLGASEPAGGSDLNAVRTVAVRRPGGWHVQGEKKFLTLGRVCDFALLLCRVELGGRRSAGRLGLFAVPRSALTIRKHINGIGMKDLDTTWMIIDAELPEEAMVGRVGTGLLAASWGLDHERLSIAAQAAGGCRRAIGLAVAHLHRREQFGRPLIEHQALRLRVAELSSRLLVLRYAVWAAAQGIGANPGCSTRDIAALKVTAARLAEEVMSECMHVFGGAGYLVDETPLARMWTDARLARLGGGSDEMMWEIVAAGLVPDDAGYDESVRWA